MEYDKDIRWKCDTANHRPEQRMDLLSDPNCMPGFNDSGAHNVNMAFHDGGLQMLAQVYENQDKMSIERAIHRITKETADFLNIDCGDISEGKTADLIVVDPSRFKTDLTLEPTEDHHPMLEGGYRLVKRSGKVVQHVFVGGEEVYKNNGTVGFHPELGKRKFGKLLRSKS
ncbi:MAG: hypothetical protein C4K58_01900 [Flavobacteriaceae bacterium]|nr:MAG: hypothetical protein C4K58_01900 [Flavobacteriaceae bacterium]